MELSRLRGRKIIERLQRQSKLWKGTNFSVRYTFGHPRHPAANTTKAAIYVGTLTSTKLHKHAVVRNRMRRRCREALRLTVKEMAVVPTAQLLILPRSASLSAPFPDLQREWRTFLSTLSHGS
jgi:ribonuclease P protein component